MVATSSLFSTDAGSCVQIGVTVQGTVHFFNLTLRASQINKRELVLTHWHVDCGVSVTFMEPNKNSVLGLSKYSKYMIMLLVNLFLALCLVSTNCWEQYQTLQLVIGFAIKPTTVGLFYMWVCHFTCYTRSQVIHRFWILIKTHCCPFVFLSMLWQLACLYMSLQMKMENWGKQTILRQRWWL